MQILVASCSTKWCLFKSLVVHSKSICKFILPWNLFIVFTHLLAYITVLRVQLPLSYIRLPKVVICLVTNPASGFSLCPNWVNIAIPHSQISKVSKDCGCDGHNLRRMYITFFFPGINLVTSKSNTFLSK